jgi:7-carboxy-7-deazaguanine synthase
VRIVDFKCPSSGEVERNDWANIDLLAPTDEAKFVIGTREDYEWAREIVRRYNLPARCAVLFSPVTGRPDADSLAPAGGWVEPVKLAEWLLEDRLNVRLGLQLHKIIWPPTARRV